MTEKCCDAAQFVFGTYSRGEHSELTMEGKKGDERRNIVLANRDGLWRGCSSCGRVWTADSEPMMSWVSSTSSHVENVGSSWHEVE